MFVVRFSVAVLFVAGSGCAAGQATTPTPAPVAAAAASLPASAAASLPASVPASLSAPESPTAALAACRALVETYAVVRDRVDVDAFAALFTEDAEFVFGENAVRGPAAIAALMQERAKGAITRHLMTTGQFELIDEKQATGLSYFVVFSESSKNLKSLPIPSTGPRAVIEYHDRFARRDGRWKIARREVKLVFVPANKR